MDDRYIIEAVEYDECRGAEIATKVGLETASHAKQALEQYLDTLASPAGATGHYRVIQEEAFGSCSAYGFDVTTVHVFEIAAEPVVPRTHPAGDERAREVLEDA